MACRAWALLLSDGDQSSGTAGPDMLADVDSTVATPCDDAVDGRGAEPGSCQPGTGGVRDRGHGGGLKQGGRLVRGLRHPDPAVPRDEDRGRNGLRAHRRGRRLVQLRHDVVVHGQGHRGRAPDVGTRRSSRPRRARQSTTAISSSPSFPRAPPGGSGWACSSRGTASTGCSRSPDGRRPAPERPGRSGGGRHLAARVIRIPARPPGWRRRARRASSGLPDGAGAEARRPRPRA